MKKIISSIIAGLVAALMTVSSAFAATVSKSFDYSGFKRLSVSNFFDVTVNKSSHFEVKVTVSKEYEDYLDVRIKNGELHIGFKSLPTKLNAKQIGRIASAEVSLPSLEGISLTGASKLSTDDSFDLGRKAFNLSVSGASNLAKLDVNAGEARMYVSGASRCILSGGFTDLHLEVSGSSRAELEASADELEAKVSGASVIEFDGQYDDVSLSSSGVGNITMGGVAGDVELKGSGTSGFDLVDLEARSVEVELGGASVSKVNAKKDLSVELSGASRCSYVDNKGMKISGQSMGRATKLKAI